MSTHLPAIRVLIADDHFATRMGLVALLDRQAELDVVAEATDGTEATELAVRHQVDLAILDIRMPEMNGIEAANLIRTRRPETKLVIATTYDEIDDIRAAVQSGIDAYLLKGTSREQFLHAITAVMRGETYFPEAIRERLQQAADGPSLTARELETLQMLAFGKSNRQIAKSLHRSEDTIKSHLKSIYRKLDVADRVTAVLEGMRRGLVRIEDDARTRGR